eukprot:Gb_35468 [translate_table: standard]
MSFARQRNSAFRAPPPSPIATAQGIKSAAVNDEILSEFLEHSLRIPDLVLPEPLIRTDIPDLNLPAFDLLSDDPKQSGVKRLVQSAIEFGCFQVINHGISSELLEEAEKECIRLFALPLETKQMVCRSDESNFGFEDIGNDSANSKMRHETFWMDRNADLIEETMRTIWPQGYKNFSWAMSNFSAALEKIASEILEILYENLGLDPFSLKELVGSENASVLCLYNHQGPYQSPSARLRHSHSHILSLHHHKGSSGFHIYADHGWITVNLKPGSLLVTVGNILKVWSNGQLKHVIGRPIACGDKHFISMEFVYLPPVPTSRIEDMGVVNIKALLKSCRRN